MLIVTDMDQKQLFNAILCTAAYEDVFDYALTAAEIHRLLAGVHTSLAHVQEILDSQGPLRYTDGFYTLPGREELAALRRQRQQTAAQLWPEALRYGRLMAGMPFVRMLAVTGSLAMNNPGADPDVDYMVVTEAGRLWTCRALLLLVARLAARRGVRLCPNYLVTERGLVIEERSLYTAHELVQMVPLSGMEVYAELRRVNHWTETFLPNAAGIPVLPSDLQRPQPGRVLNLMETGLRLPPGDWLEVWEMGRKVRKLSREQGDSPEARFSADLCKGHKDRHGEQALNDFRRRIDRLALEIEL